MAAVVFPSALNDPATGYEAMAQQPTNTLRRAVYVHISDLTSAYNIDHAMLEDELARVKEETLMAAQKLVDPSLSGAAATAVLGVPTELDTSAATQRRLQPPRTGFNLCVLVGKVSVVVDKNRVDGTRVRLAEVEVGDETGIVSLRARDDQIDILEEVSSRSGAVVIRNCTLELYQGKHIRLAVTKWGKLSRYPDQIASTPPPPSKINRDRNFSLIDLSKVASDMVNYPGTVDPYQQSSETENQANRLQPYSSMGRRGRRPPTATRAKPAPGHYGEASAGLQGPAATYPATGLHGYGGIDSGPYHYQPRQPDNLPPQQQQIMMHQQYEMQQHHRHMHQPPSHMGGYPQDHMGSPPSVSTPINPGAFPPSSNFEANPFGVALNPFMVPNPSSSTSSGSAPHPTDATESGTGRADSPHGKMNPQAATFDPNSRR